MMKRRILAVLMTLVMVLALTACGGSAKEETAAYDSAAGSPMEPYREAPKAEAEMVYTEESYIEYGSDMKYSATADSANSSAGISGQKLIRTATLEMETTEFEEAAQGMTDLTEELGGYYESSNVYNRKNGSRWAEYTVRIPAGKYNAFLTLAGELCHVTRQESRQEDVSEVYYDTAGRLKTQQIKLERLQSLLAQAELMEDIITIESAISETEMAIDSLSGTLRHYDGKVDYATIHVNLQEVYKLSNVEEVPDTFGERLGRSFTRGINNFVDSLENLAVSFAYSWMWWLLAVVIAVVVIRVARKRMGKLPRLRKKKNAEPDDKAE